MYEDRRETFSIKDIVLQLLFIVLLVFILIWLFPTKGYLEKKLDGIEAGIDEKLKPLYTRLFTDNILTMKDAAKSYFTTPRLPQEVGDKVTMTLGEMYEKGLLLELVDSNNNACDTTKSYIELTKTEEEYELKVTLSCSDKEAYIIEHLGCYDYCNGRLCTKEEAKAEESKTVTPVSKKYKYEYVLTTGEKCSNYGSWGEWTTNKVEENKTTKVQTKTEKEFDHYEQVYTVVDTKYKDVEYYDDVYYGYSTRTIKKTATYNYTTKTTTTLLSYATKTYEANALYDYIYTTNTTTGTGSTTSSTWEYVGTTSSKTPKQGNATTKYERISAPTQDDCGTACADDDTYYYKVYELRTTTTPGTPTTTTTKRCPDNTRDTGAGCLATSTRTENYCPVGTDNGSGCVDVKTEKYCADGTNENAAKTGCEKVTYEKQNYCALDGTNTGSGCVLKVKKTKKVAELVYGYVNGEAIYKNVTYYRTATRTCTNTTTDYKWSESSSDATLKAQGYTLTGKTAEI